MIGGDAVAENCQYARAMNIGKRAGGFGHVFKIWRQLDVGGTGFPFIKVAFRDGHALPAGVAFEDFAVFLAILFGGDGGADGGFHFLRGGPDFAQIDRLAGFARAEWLGGEIQIHAAGEGVGNNERRRREIVGANERVDAAFKIAIAAEDGDGEEIIFLDGGADGVRQRAAVADAGGAAVADEIEFQVCRDTA